MKTFKNTKADLNAEATVILFAQAEVRPTTLKSNFIECKESEIEGEHLYTEYFKENDKFYMVRFYGNL